MNWQAAQNIFFLGIGGIGMSSLARYFNSIGKNIGGYDKTPSDITDALKVEGIQVIFEDSIAALSALDNWTSLPHTLIVYTPAVPKTSILFNHFRDQGFAMMKRAQALGLVTKETVNLSIAGTHGKTTTSCLLAHLLQCGNIPSVSILGGISANFESNYLNTLSEGDTPISVTEADEFDRSFLHLTPTTAAITSLDADHLDIYGNEDSIRQSFFDFARCVKPHGKLYAQVDLQEDFHSVGLKATTYGINSGQVSAHHVHIHEHEYVFDLYYTSDVIRNLKLGIPGKHNVENAVVASAIALDYGIDEDTLRTGLLSFKGVKRRFEYILKAPTIFIDDYAHHPTELNAIISSVREMYPEHEITGIFQPHLYTRTRDFASGFSKSLSLLDKVILLDIYPARELPIDGVNSEMLLSDIGAKGQLLSKSETLTWVDQNRPRLLLTLGAGDIDRMVPQIKEILTKPSAHA